jgi:hypothetical protein
VFRLAAVAFELLEEAAVCLALVFVELSVLCCLPFVAAAAADDDDLDLDLDEGLELAQPIFHLNKQQQNNKTLKDCWNFIFLCNFSINLKRFLN